MGPERIRGAGQSRFLTISAAAGLVLAGLALSGSRPAHSGIFRDAAYGPAPKHHVKLTGVVTGTVTCNRFGKSEKCTKISIRKGKKAKRVGTWTMGPGSCAGFGPGTMCSNSGTGKKMKVGRLKGKVAVSVRCEQSGNTGTLSQSGKADEELSLKKCLGHAKGDKFKFTLGY